MANVLERLRDVANAHDPHGLASLFAEDYQSTQPLHPGRDFVGRAQVLKNWISAFEGVPDFTAELLASTVDGRSHGGTTGMVTTTTAQPSRCADSRSLCGTA
jgi:hypothetical protein